MMVLGFGDGVLEVHCLVPRRCDDDDEEDEQAGRQGSASAGGRLWYALPPGLNCSHLLGCPYPVQLWLCLCLFVFL